MAVLGAAWLEELRAELDRRLDAADPLDPGIAPPPEPWAPAIVPLLGLERRGAKLYRPGTSASLDGREEEAAALEAAVAAEGFGRVEDGDVAAFLEREGRLYRVGDGFAVSPELYERGLAAIRELSPITIAAVRDRLGVSRRVAQLLLERFDADGLTRRVGDERVLRRAARRMNERELIERYNQAWNDHDVDAIVSMHAPDMVFENHTAGERAEGEAVGAAHRRDLPQLADLQFRARRLYVREGLVGQRVDGERDARGRPQARMGRHRRLPDRGREDQAQGRLLRREPRAGNRLADFEGEDVRPVVVAGRIEALPFGVQLLRIELRVEDAFLVPQRPRQVLAVGADDRGAAATEQVAARRRSARNRGSSRRAGRRTG